MFIVEGELGGDRYTVRVGGPDPVYGVVGSSIITGYLAGREGYGYDATPTGPFGVLDMKNPETVLGALLAWTRVDKVTGDAPDVLGEQRHDQPGVVY